MSIIENSAKTIAAVLFASCLFIVLPTAGFSYTEVPAGTICTTSWGPGTIFVTGKVTDNDRL